MKLEVSGVCCSFEGERVLENMDLRADTGEVVAVIGPSGCGKSTLLNIMAGTLPAEDGTVLVDGKRVNGISGHFAYMPQKDLLFPWKTIRENVCLYARLNGGLEEARTAAAAGFEKFGLAGCEDKYPHQLSGGMRQRAAFLRTALCDADIMLLDEPFGALDVITREKMQDWLLDIRRSGELNRTTVLVTHDMDEAIYLADRIIVLAGRPASVRGEVVVCAPCRQARDREWLLAQAETRAELYRLLRD